MKFNTILKRKIRTPDTINLAGGRAFTQSNQLELVNILLTSFLENKFYRSGNATAKRLVDLIGNIADKKFVAKAALYARREAGMRSASHLVAGEIAQQVKGQDWTKRFFDRITYRVDDATEILAYTMAVYGKPLPNALKKGLGQALTRFDAHQLAKYRGENSALKLVDAVNLVHPPHTEALGALVNGTLKPAQTWETKLTKAGQDAENAQDKFAKKAHAWADLIRSRKIGYFALLRNLRNILEQAPELADDAIALLTNKELIKRSLVLPFRFRTALDAIEQAGDLPGRQKVIQALSRAIDHSLANTPRFDGRTLIAMDCSGSMIGKPMKIGSLFAAVLYKRNDADLMLFSGDAKHATFNKNDATLTLAQRIEDKAEWSGTNFDAVFQRARNPYHRVIILSDMQAWIGHDTPAKSFEAFVKRTGQRPRVYSFDLAGHGSLQFPERDVYCLAGFSDKSMETLRFLDQDQSALLSKIEQIDL
jgi:60 kDa SS-A/Ro ribonucleoprotein